MQKNISRIRILCIACEKSIAESFVIERRCIVCMAPLLPSVQRQIAQLFLTEFSHISLSALRILVNFALRRANLFEIRSRASARAAAAASPQRFSCLELKLRTSLPVRITYSATRSTTILKVEIDTFREYSLELYTPCGSSAEHAQNAILSATGDSTCTATTGV